MASISKGVPTDDRAGEPREEIAAKALFNKGVSLGTLGRYEEEIAVYNDLLARFGDSTELPLREQAAKALFNKGVSLGTLGRYEEEIAVYNDLLARFGDATELPQREHVAKALYSKGFRLGTLGRYEEEIAVYDDLLARFGSATESPLFEQAAKAKSARGLRKYGAPPSEPTQEHVVLLVHGIRTTARWVGMVKETLECTSTTPLTVEPVSYGIFSLWRFLLPGPSRRAPVAAVAKYLRAVRARDNDLAKAPNERRLISVIAHSFGTYCLFRTLDQNPNIKLHRVILCGSVLPQNFDVDRYRGQLGSSKVLNECGDRDPWPVVAKKIAWGCGSAGTFGLFSERATNRFHRNGHSDYFDAGFVRDMWLPFFEHGEVKASDWDRARNEHPGPWWIRALDRVPLKLLFISIGVLVIVVAPFRSQMTMEYHHDVFCPTAAILAKIHVLADDPFRRSC